MPVTAARLAQPAYCGAGMACPQAAVALAWQAIMNNSMQAAALTNIDAHADVHMCIGRCKYQQV